MTGTLSYGRRLYGYLSDVLHSAVSAGFAESFSFGIICFIVRYAVRIGYGIRKDIAVFVCGSPVAGV